MRRLTRDLATVLTPGLALLWSSWSACAESPKSLQKIRPVAAEYQVQNSYLVKEEDADSGTSTSSDPLTLETLTQMAEENNPILRRNRARVAASQGDALQLGLWENPKFDTNNPQVFAGRNSAFNVGFAQEIPVMGKKRLDRAAGEKFVHQQQYAYVQERMDLLTNVREQFYKVDAAQRRVKLYKLLYKLTQQSANSAQKVFEAGQTARVDALLLQIDSETVAANLANSERLLTGARKQLAALIGVPSVAHEEVKGNLHERPPEYDDQVLQQFVTSQSAIMQIAKLDVDRNRIILRRAEVEKYPNPYVGPAYQVGVVQGQESFWFNISFPITVWNRNQGGVASARASVRQAEEQVNATQLDQLKKLADAYSRYQATQVQADKYRQEIIPRTQQAYHFVLEGRKHSAIDQLQFLQAQRTMVETHVAYLGILENLWQAAADLAGLLQLDQFP